MQSDEVVWKIINHGHCSFKAKMQRQNFCRNEHNVTGLCNRSSCPLANSRYATIREERGRLYLCIKTVERAHTPNKLWQKIRLSPKYMKALEQVNEHLAHWPKFLVHKNKQRLTKITQYLIRMRRLALKPRVALVTQPTRVKQQEARKEKKALKAAQVEKSIEKELLSRLHAGTYGDIYNFPSMQYNKALDKEAVADGEEEAERAVARRAAAVAAGGSEDEGAEEEEESEEGEMELEYESDDEDVQYVEDLEESDDDMEDIGARWAASSSDEGESGRGSGSEGEDSGDAAAPPAAGQRHKRQRGDREARGAGAAARKRGRGVEWEIEEEAAPATRRTA